MLAVSAVFEGKPLAVFARGPNVTLAAARALPQLSGLEAYTLRDGFRSYTDFLNRPKSLEVPYRLRLDNKERLDCDREIPFFFIRWKALLGPDIPDLLKATKGRGTFDQVLNGDWGTREP